MIGKTPDPHVKHPRLARLVRRLTNAQDAYLPDEMGDAIATLFNGLADMDEAGRGDALLQYSDYPRQPSDTTEEESARVEIMTICTEELAGATVREAATLLAKLTRLPIVEIKGSRSGGTEMTFKDGKKTSRPLRVRRRPVPAMRS